MASLSSARINSVTVHLNLPVNNALVCYKREWGGKIIECRDLQALQPAQQLSVLQLLVFLFFLIKVLKGRLLFDNLMPWLLFLFLKHTCRFRLVGLTSDPASTFRPFKHRKQTKNNSLSTAGKVAGKAQCKKPMRCNSVWSQLQLINFKRKTGTRTKPDRVGPQVTSHY